MGLESISEAAPFIGILCDSSVAQTQALRASSTTYSNFGTCEVKNWLEVLNAWVFVGRNGLIKGWVFSRRGLRRKTQSLLVPKELSKGPAGAGKQTRGQVGNLQLESLRTRIAKWARKTRTKSMGVRMRCVPRCR